MHTRNLLYTAATRASESLYILGDAASIQTCALRTEPARRRTFLSVFPMGRGAA
jgi:ATP-dependent exoDNAse (exonuclease V) alpha subunit